MLKSYFTLFLGTQVGAQISLCARNLCTTLACSILLRDNVMSALILTFAFTHLCSLFAQLICCTLCTLLRVSTTLHNDIQASISLPLSAWPWAEFSLFSFESICLPCLRGAMRAFSISQTDTVWAINVPIPMLCLLRCSCSCSVLAAITNLSVQNPLLFHLKLAKKSA